MRPGFHPGLDVTVTLSALLGDYDVKLTFYASSRVTGEDAAMGSQRLGAATRHSDAQRTDGSAALAWNGHDGRTSELWPSFAVP